MNWFKSKNRLIKELKDCRVIIGKLMLESRSKLEELEPSKTYYIQTNNPDGTKEAIDYLQRTIPWTLPPIIISPDKIEEVTPEKMERFVYRPHYLKMIVDLLVKPMDIHEMAKNINANVGQLRRVVQQLQKEEIFEVDTKDKKFVVSLTPHGEKVAKALANLKEVVKNG